MVSPHPCRIIQGTTQSETLLGTDGEAAWPHSQAPVPQAQGAGERGVGGQKTVYWHFPEEERVFPDRERRSIHASCRGTQAMGPCLEAQERLLHVHTMQGMQA